MQGGVSLPATSKAHQENAVSSQTAVGEAEKPHPFLVLHTWRLQKRHRARRDDPRQTSQGGAPKIPTLTWQVASPAHHHCLGFHLSISFSIIKATRWVFEGAGGAGIHPQISGNTKGSPQGISQSSLSQGSRYP